MPSAFCLIPWDQKYNNFLFYEDKDCPVRPRKCYADLACPQCLKMNEDAALARGVAPEFKPRLSGDICQSDDGVYLFSQAARSFFEGHALSGLRFVPIPSDDRYLLALPEVFVSAGRAICSYRSACSSCGRWEWGGFCSNKMALPTDQRVVFAMTPFDENRYGRLTVLHCSPLVAELLLVARREKRLKKFSVLEFTTDEPSPET